MTFVPLATPVSSDPHSHGPHFAVGPPVAGAVPSDSNTPNLRSLQAEIERIVATVPVKNEAVRAFLGVARQLTNANDVSYAARQGSELRLIGDISSPLLQNEQHQAQLHRWSVAACQSGEVQLNRIDGLAEMVVSLPVYDHGMSSEALHCALVVPNGQIESVVVGLQLVATGMTAWYARRAASDNQFEASTSAAAIELLSACNVAESEQESHYVLVTELQKLLGCECVAFADQRRSQAFHISAMSGAAELDDKSSLIRLLADCAAEAAVKKEGVVWPPLSHGDRQASLVHQQLVRATPHEAVRSVPVDLNGAMQGVLLLMGRQAILHDDVTGQVVDALTPHLASTLALRSQAEAGPLRRLLRSAKGSPGKRKQRKALMLGAVAVAFIMLCPIPHRIACDCTVEPTVKRFATVPFDGILQESLVKPGDIVTEGQVLAKMDGRDLRFERAEASAAWTQAKKEHDVFTSKDQIADAQIARFEVAEMQAKLDWVQHREDHLEVKAGIDGVVVAGDLTDAQGASVRRGEVLFEVAPLDSLKLKLAIPEQSIAYVDEKMALKVRLEGTPGKSFSGEVGVIKPRASAETGANLFTAAGHLSATDGALRPGMSGTAHVIGDRRPIGWIVFHRVYRKIVDFIEW